MIPLWIYIHLLSSTWSDHKGISSVILSIKTCLSGWDRIEWLLPFVSPWRVPYRWCNWCGQRLGSCHCMRLGNHTWKIAAQHLLHPWNLTWNFKITQLKRKTIFQTSMFGFHVNFPGCTSDSNRYLRHVQPPHIPSAEGFLNGTLSPSLSDCDMM